MRNQKFVIMPHFRLHEWVAEEKGYFADEGLDYEFQETVQSTDGKAHAQGDKVGAMQTFEKGRTSDISCACHWTVNVAAAKGHGKLYGDVYSVSPAGIFVPADSKIKIAGGSRRRADLGRLPVGQPLLDHPGARAVHAAGPDQSVVRRRHAVQPHGAAARRQDPGLHAVLRPVLLRRAARLPQGDRLHLHDRHDDHRRSRSGGRAQILPRAARAQRDIDLRPELYTHYYKNEFPKRFHATMDTRRWGPGERIVFEPYSREVFEESREWIRERGIFEGNDLGAKPYESAVVSLAV